jgi:hypothetical protein
MKEKDADLANSRKKIIEQIPDFSSILPGSLLSRMVRCNKAGCQYCQKGKGKQKGKGHGPIWILSVSLGSGRVRQVPVPRELKDEVLEGQRAFVQTQRLLKQIAMVNLDLLKERKRRE